MNSMTQLNVCFPGAESVQRGHMRWHSVPLCRGLPTSQNSWANVCCV